MHDVFPPLLSVACSCITANVNLGVNANSANARRISLKKQSLHVAVELWYKDQRYVSIHEEKSNPNTSSESV